MKSFTLIGVGFLTHSPELIVKGHVNFTHFYLTGDDYVRKAENGGACDLVATTVCFTAYGPLAEAIARNCRKGDQLVVEARLVRSESSGSEARGNGNLTFVVDGFRFGAPGKTKRDELENWVGEANPD
jgi:single-strand DNA-binding protein